VDAVIDRKRAEKATPQSLGLLAPADWREVPEPHSLIERPTPAPRDAAVLLYKQAVRETALYRTEIARLNDVYTAEIARLNDVYTAEIARIAETRRFRGLCMLSYRLGRQMLEQLRARLGHLSLTFSRFFGRL